MSQMVRKQILTIRENGTNRVQSINNDPDMCQQQFKQDCDVNHIMEKYLKTGVISHIRGPGHYLDLVDLPDYQESLHTVIKAQDKFMELPADVRLQFDNDPHKFIEFLGDPSKEAEHIKMGLRSPKEPDPIMETLGAIAKNTAPPPKPKKKATEEA